MINLISTLLPKLLKCISISAFFDFMVLKEIILINVSEFPQFLALIDTINIFLHENYQFLINFKIFCFL